MLSNTPFYQNTLENNTISINNNSLTHNNKVYPLASIINVALAKTSRPLQAWLGISFITAMVALLVYKIVSYALSPHILLSLHQEFYNLSHNYEYLVLVISLIFITILSFFSWLKYKPLYYISIDLNGDYKTIAFSANKKEVSAIYNKLQSLPNN